VRSGDYKKVKCEEKSVQIPESLRKYFWDVNWEDFKLQAGLFEDFIMCRIADKGNMEAVRWLMDRYTIDRISDAVIRSRTVSGKTRLFWEHAANFF
jgi:hypothetical protein